MMGVTHHSRWLTAAPIPRTQILIPKPHVHFIALKSSLTANLFSSRRHASRFIPVRCEKETSTSSSAPSQTTSPGGLKNWPTVGVALLSIGFFLGPILDGIHSDVELQLYKNGAIAIGPLHTDVVVPPLLGAFYGVVGLLQLTLDKWLAPKGWQPKTSSSRVLFSLIFLITILEVSAQLFRAGAPYNVEAYILFALAEVNWLLFDGTWWGFALATVVGTLCPLSEIPLMKFFDLWHYSKPNIEVFGEGSVTWVLACYFSYVPFLANLSRWLSSQIIWVDSD